MTHVRFSYLTFALQPAGFGLRCFWSRPSHLMSGPQVRRRPEAQKLPVSGGRRRLQRLDSAQREEEAAANAGAPPGRRGGRR